MKAPDPAALRRSVASSIAIETGESPEAIERCLAQSVLVMPGQNLVRCPACDFILYWRADKSLECRGMTSCQFYGRVFRGSQALVLFTLESKEKAE